MYHSLRMANFRISAGIQHPVSLFLFGGGGNCRFYVFRLLVFVMFLLERTCSDRNESRRDSLVFEIESTLSFDSYNALSTCLELCRVQSKALLDWFKHPSPRGGQKFESMIRRSVWWKMAIGCRWIRYCRWPIKTLHGSMLPRVPGS